MSDTRTDSVTELEELLDAEIPCRGVYALNLACSASAVLHSSGHGCPVPANDKCMQCWLVWYKHAAGIVMHFGRIQCAVCKGLFASPEAFSDYRPF